VGKSTFFNRLTESRKAIVDEQSGVTRDRHYGKVFWNGIEFSVIDTGGYVEGSDDIFEGEIRKQVHLAIEECDLILFVVDVQSGITDLDSEVAAILRRVDKPVVLVVNKVDNNAQRLDANEFYNMGLDLPLYMISSINGSGTGDLLDHVVEKLPSPQDIPGEDGVPKFAIVGRPNVGKSSFANALLDQERNIVTPIAGTTRDTLMTRYRKFDFDFFLLDTAGLRKKGKVHDDLEFYSVIRSVRAIEASDVCFVMVDATRGFEGQDLNIFGLAQRNFKGVVILVNKWDLVEKDTMSTQRFTETIQEKIAPFTDVPILFVSALTKQRVHKALEMGMKVYRSKNLKVPTAVLNKTLLPIIEQTPPPSLKGKHVKIKYVTQLPTPVPSFAFFCNLPQYVKPPYKRFLENQLRKSFDLEGVPINVFMRKK